VHVHWLVWLPYLISQRMAADYLKRPVLRTRHKTRQKKTKEKRNQPEDLRNQKTNSTVWRTAWHEVTVQRSYTRIAFRHFKHTWQVAIPISCTGQTIFENGEGGGALRRAAMQTNNESKKNFSLTKEGKSASGYGGRWKDGSRTGTWFVLVPHSLRSAVPQQRNIRKNNHRRPWACSDVLTLSNWLRLYDRQSNQGAA